MTGHQRGQRRQLTFGSPRSGEIAVQITCPVCRARVFQRCKGAGSTQWFHEGRLSACRAEFDRLGLVP